jgi:hypothetical protein
MRTAWGDPDLRGIWQPDGGPPLLERPARFGDKEALTDDELAAERKAEKERRTERHTQTLVRGLAGGGGSEGHPSIANFSAIVPTRRTSAIVDPPDGRLPPWTPETIVRYEARVAARSDRGEAGAVLDIGYSERCLRAVEIAAYTPLAYVEAGGDARNLPLNALSARAIVRTQRILQVPGYVVIVKEEDIADFRIIPIDRPALDPAIRQYRGASRGHWDGNTLVVETTNINDKQDGGAILPAHLGVSGLTSPEPWLYPGTGETLKLTERFTRRDAHTLDYRVTIEDPKVYTRPYTMLLEFQRDDQFFVHQYQCHENNSSMPNILASGRADPQYAAESAAEVREKWRIAWEKLKVDWAQRKDR